VTKLFPLLFCFINFASCYIPSLYTSSYNYKSSKKYVSGKDYYLHNIYIHLVKSRKELYSNCVIYTRIHVLMYIQKEQCHQPYMNHSQPINIFQTPFSILFLGKDKPSPSSSKTLYTSHSRSPITCLPTSAC